ncbi:MAG TPA: hypothetical protein VF633_02025 [Brevundimonas sp.]|jgi:hypothetical protein
MAELSVAHRMALGQLIGGVPDRTLRMLSLAVAGMPGDKARDLELMLSQESIHRARRARGFGALAPLFHPRPDGVEAMTFPAGVLPRLWNLAAAREQDLLPLLDTDDDREASRTAAVCGRLYASAAAAVRDQPEAVWPAGLCDPESRARGLIDLGHACDFGGLVHRALPSLKAWVGRPDGDQLAELRLLIRDASAMTSDGAQRLLDILFAHLADAALVLRLVVHTSSAAAREAFLSESELATFVERLIAGVQVRAQRVSAFQPGHPIASLRADLIWCADVLQELDATIHLDREGPWGKTLRDARVRIGKRLGELLSGVTRVVDKTTPMQKVQTAGRMTRAVPRLEIAIEPKLVQAATDALAMVALLRNLAAPFGCEAQRGALIQSLTVQLSEYGDLVIEEVNAGDAPEETPALERAAMAARFLEQIGAVTEARAVRRRAAVAGGPAPMKRSA